MSDLTEFLLARITEDEALARAVGQEDPWIRQGLRYQSEFDSAVGEGCDPPFAWTASEEVAEHIARHEPARVLAECEAKRRIEAEHRPNLMRFCGTCRYGAVEPASWPCITLRSLALPYADHPDYREEWRP